MSSLFPSAFPEGTNSVTSDANSSSYLENPRKRKREEEAEDEDLDDDDDFSKMEQSMNQGGDMDNFDNENEISSLFPSRFSEKPQIPASEPSKEEEEDNEMEDHQLDNFDERAPTSPISPIDNNNAGDTKEIINKEKALRIAQKKKEYFELLKKKSQTQSRKKHVVSTQNMDAKQKARYQMVLDFVMPKDHCVEVWSNDRGSSSQITPSRMIKAIGRNFVGELVEEARKVMIEWGETNPAIPIQPHHLREAHRRLRKAMSYPAPLYLKKNQNFK